MPHPALMAEARRAWATKAGAGRHIGYCHPCRLVITRGTHVCEHGVTASREALIRLETAQLERALLDTEEQAA